MHFMERNGGRGGGGGRQMGKKRVTGETEGQTGETEVDRRTDRRGQRKREREGEREKKERNSFVNIIPIASHPPNRFLLHSLKLSQTVKINTEFKLIFKCCTQQFLLDTLPAV